MIVRSLLDVNVLIAILDSDHVHHVRARDWFTRHVAQGWASCPITQNGCIRIFSQPAYPASLPIPEIARRLRQATAAADHEFWTDEISLTEARRFDLTRVPHPRFLTDAYLLGLAVAHKARLVTFDHRIPSTAVLGATGKNLLAL